MKVVHLKKHMTYGLDRKCVLCGYKSDGEDRGHDFVSDKNFLNQSLKIRKDIINCNSDMIDMYFVHEE
jgi:hypothetical protein